MFKQRKKAQNRKLVHHILKAQQQQPQSLWLGASCSMAETTINLKLSAWLYRIQSQDFMALTALLSIYRVQDGLPTNGGEKRSHNNHWPMGFFFISLSTAAQSKRRVQVGSATQQPVILPIYRALFKFLGKLC